MKRLAVIALALGVVACHPPQNATKIVNGLPAPPKDPETPFTSPLASATHVGSAACAPCHAAEHAEWDASPHADTIRSADSEDEDLLASIIPCSDMTFTHVLGKRHELRFLVERPDVPWGQGRWLALPCSWRPHEKAPEVHHPDDWRTLPFESSCAACHATGFQRDFSFRDPGVGCENCHGPGSSHVAAPSQATIVSFHGTARDEVTICGSCHLQEGVSRRTGRNFPDGFVPGGSLFDDFRYDWSKLHPSDTTKALDVHQKILIQRIVYGGDESLRCTSCHAMHSLSHDKHQGLPKQDYCFTCHQPDMKVKEYSESCNVCEF